MAAIQKPRATHDLHVDKLFSVRGYVCVVTGGGSGIGLMCSQALAANGARVYITSRRDEALQKAASSHTQTAEGEIIPLGPCDVTKKDDLERIVEEVAKKEKKVDLLITNAGIGGPKAEPDTSDAAALKKKLWENETFEGWSQVFNTDVSAVYFTAVAFLPLLAAASTPSISSSIIVISSMSGIMRESQGHFSYNAAKGATVHLSKLMSKEFEKAGIRVNSIAPGYFPSEMTMKESGEDQKTEMPHEKVQEKGHTPAQRPGSDEEMAMAVLFFARNTYVNGEIVAVDGGTLNAVPGR